MRRARKCLGCVVIVVIIVSGTHYAEAAGAKRFRVLVRVAPPDGEAPREGDERPAEVALRFPELLGALGDGLVPDLTTLAVQRLDPDTMTPVPSIRFAHSATEFDIPWRWYDASLGYDFPENSGNLDANEGKLAFNSIPRFGYFYDCIGDWREGRLAFTHRVTGEGPALYAVSFAVLPDGTEPGAVPPRGFLGDGLQRCEPRGASTTGLIHSRVDVTDWNGDGLFDLVIGCARGGVVWYPNKGNPGAPRFPVSHLVRTADGFPLDIGWSAAPHAVDWDGDGDTDLLVGGEWNRVVLFRNARDGKGEPLLENAGLLRLANGEPFHVPWQPSPETEPSYTYTKDYYSVLETADWDDDGDLDLLAGGYVTGRVYLFENVGQPGEEPRLRLVGPVEADGEPLDVAWCAAPTVGDLDGDGDLDLISGSMPMTEGGGDSASRERFLTYFRNDGARADPRLRKVVLPHTGAFPAMALSTPRFIDWTNDGTLDLVVSASTQVFLYRNVGTTAEPRFEAHGQALPSQWGTATLSMNQFVDWNDDGFLDGVNAPYVHLSTGKGSPGTFDQPISLLKPGQTISHLSGIGDDWQYLRLYDLDNDGLIDLMDADHSGHFWWHPNRGTQHDPDLDSAGVMLALKDGGPVSVGEGRSGFNALQGARATYAVGDFDGDGLQDLVTSDFSGAVRYFRQADKTTESEAPIFEAGIDVGKMAGRAAPSAADWNGDGWMDVVVASSATDAAVFLGRGEVDGSPFQAAQPLALANAPYGSGAPVVVADYNGDGDQDIILYTAYGYMCFYEHSHITSGYAQGEVVSVEREK
jgi:FG-GAP-like repeat